MKKFGFTLAEVLVTLTIIGVVAAVTLPALQQNMSNRGLEAQTSKFYRNLSEAVGRYMADNELGSLTITDFKQATVEQFIQNNFKISKACKKLETSGCFASSYSSFDGTKSEDVNNTLPANNAWGSQAYALVDGAVINYYGFASGDKSEAIGCVMVDVNGSKRPNRNGYDRWVMYIFSDGSVDDYGIYPKLRLDADKVQNEIATDFKNCKAKGNIGGKAYGCLATFMRNGFKFTSDWE